MTPSKSDLLDYEIRSSWWACWVSWPWAQALAGKYFAWKVNRKCGRWVASLKAREEVEAWRDAWVGMVEEKTYPMDAGETVKSVK